MLFGFGKKKKKSNQEHINLEEGQFCAVVEVESDEVTHEYHFLADEDHYCLLYRDGQFLGMPRPAGGKIYPFSVDPTKEGSRGDLKKYTRAKLVYLSKDFNLLVNWGTSSKFLLEDTVTHKPYSVGARGVFYVNIDPTDAARKADRFYKKCLSQGNASMYDTEKLRDFLRHGFIMHIGAKIQEYIEKSGRSLENYVGLQPGEILKISQELYPTMKDIFAEYGLTIVSTSQGSILQGIEVEAANRG